MNWGYLVLLVCSVLLALQSSYSAALMLYAWQDDRKREKGLVPKTYKRPRIHFTILLPARHEEEVIQDTIQRVVDLNYPRELVQMLVVIEAGDHGTIAKVNQKLAELAAKGIHNVRLITFTDKPINKPHGLNIGLKNATGNVITIFDAEDEPHPDILQVVNTVITREFAPVVQCGVQLMNYKDRWFSALNVLEYFFWFKSRLHYHASAGSVPLGGNTVFVWKQLLDWLGGWDQYCLTEDADAGIRLSAAGVPVRVIYEDEFVTKEETPPTVGQFVKQRTRWNQGFLQVLGKWDWLKLPTWKQRLLALYTLSSPLIQLLTLLYVPVSLWMMFFVKVPAWLALISTLPLYMMIVQLLISLAGLRQFTRAHGLKASPLAYLRLVITFLPYQILLGWGAVRACWRQLRGLNSWEKTLHVGAHRAAPVAPQSRPHVPAGRAPLGAFTAQFMLDIERRSEGARHEQAGLEEAKLG
ncbi:MAG TPA: glycosyltransferase [Chloroflexia bacterium]|nr:glycosyltransferase [Chloroflexia bacterium]